MTTVDEWFDRFRREDLNLQVRYLDQDDHGSNAWESLSSSLNHAIADLHINYAYGSDVVTPDDEAVLGQIVSEVNGLYWKTRGDLEVRYKTFIDYVTSGDPILQNWALLRILDTPQQQINDGSFPVFPLPTVVVQDESGQDRLNLLIGPNFYHGDWAEVIVFNRMRSVSERGLVVHYLNGRYGLGAK